MIGDDEHFGRRETRIGKTVISRPPLKKEAKNFVTC